MTAITKCRVGFAFYVAAAVSVAWVLTGCEYLTPPKSPPAAKPAEQPYDENYIAALAVADEFCRAWKNGDFAAGKTLMTRRLVRQHSDTRLSDAIAGTSSPRHAAFEISAGEHLPDGRIAFKLRLFLSYPGQFQDRLEAPLERMVLAAAQAGRWRVDEFPIP